MQFVKFDHGPGQWRRLPCPGPCLGAPLSTCSSKQALFFFLLRSDFWFVLIKSAWNVDIHVMPIHVGQPLYLINESYLFQRTKCHACQSGVLYQWEGALSPVHTRCECEWECNTNVDGTNSQQLIRESKAVLNICDTFPVKTKRWCRNSLRIRMKYEQGFRRTKNLACYSIVNCSLSLLFPRPCVGIKEEPTESNWYCPRCRVPSKKKGKKKHK